MVVSSSGGGGGNDFEPITGLALYLVAYLEVII